MADIELVIKIPEHAKVINVNGFITTIALYWRILENRMDVLRYCSYCGKEIEIEADKEE